MVTLKDALKEMLDYYKLKSKLHQSSVRKSWQALMGPTISQYTKEVKLTGKKLYIHIESASLRQELSYGKEKIKALMNESLGEDYIEDVIIR